MSGTNVREIETEAGTLRLRDHLPFRTMHRQLGEEMRKKYPLPRVGTMPKVKWDGEVAPREFIENAKERWMALTGCHPGKFGPQGIWFRQAVLEGVPESVKKAMVSNPDMQVAESHV